MVNRQVTEALDCDVVVIYNRDGVDCKGEREREIGRCGELPLIVSVKFCIKVLLQGFPTNEYPPLVQIANSTFITGLHYTINMTIIASLSLMECPVV